MNSDLRAVCRVGGVFDKAVWHDNDPGAGRDALHRRRQNDRRNSMPRKFVDLSIFLENDVLSDPPAFAPKIQYFTHEHTFEQIEPFFPA
jgi:hypothetical protein